ncbi:MAG: LPS export ABC transporter periplasmic protein LptC [Prevotellaceae bacterium]|nr:LPS export ABC transporter periplasmic protein LptC [Prevotellaceae bacterium]
MSITMPLFWGACSGRGTLMGDAITERDSLPVMDTEGVTSLISDSGVTRYRVKTKEWLVYDRKTPSYWAFEKGIYLEKFDTLFDVEASIKADTAYYYDKKRLWELIGNVDIVNVKGERFQTELLYWDQNKRTVYSDKFVRITQPERIITSLGFDSNEQMTVYTFRKPQGIFYFEDTPVASPDSLGTTPTDTLSVTPKAP